MSSYRIDYTYLTGLEGMLVSDSLVYKQRNADTLTVEEAAYRVTALTGRRNVEVHTIVPIAVMECDFV